MALPIEIEMAPMESRAVDSIPEGDDWLYEPKWDGFRCLAFRDGKDGQLQSKAGQPLARYFPELVEELLGCAAGQYVLDGEIVVPDPGVGLSFDKLLQRVHPAESRVKRLAAETPALYIVFDLLVDERGRDLSGSPLKARRTALETFYKKYLKRLGRVVLSPATRDIETARGWFGKAGAATDGIMAKDIEAAYASGKRDAMKKIKPLRTADCVVGGFRYASGKQVVGSLLLGLYNDDGLLDHVGYCSGLTSKMRSDFTPQLEKLVEPPGFTGSSPGGPSRWSTERSSKWEPLKTKLVVEVGWDHFTNGRFRHGTKFVRWRPDKAPGQCTLDQIARTGPDSFGLLELS